MFQIHNKYFIYEYISIIFSQILLMYVYRKIHDTLKKKIHNMIQVLTTMVTKACIVGASCILEFIFK